MLDIDRILNYPKKKKDITQKKDLFDLDSMFPGQKKSEDNSIFNPKKKLDEGKVIVHNHYYQTSMPLNFNRRIIKKKKFRLVSLEGDKAFNDDDGDGYPNYMDPAPNNPNIPRKKMIWEKTMRSIYRGEKDE